MRKGISCMCCAAAVRRASGSNKRNVEGECRSRGVEGRKGAQRSSSLFSALIRPPFWGGGGWQRLIILVSRGRGNTTVLLCMMCNACDPLGERWRGPRRQNTVARAPPALPGPALPGPALPGPPWPLLGRSLAARVGETGPCALSRGTMGGPAVRAHPAAAPAPPPIVIRDPYTARIPHRHLPEGRLHSIHLSLRGPGTSSPPQPVASAERRGSRTRRSVLAAPACCDVEDASREGQERDDQVGGVLGGMATTASLGAAPLSMPGEGSTMQSGHDSHSQNHPHGAPHHSQNQNHNPSPSQGLGQHGGTSGSSGGGPSASGSNGHAGTSASAGAHTADGAGGSGSGAGPSSAGAAAPKAKSKGDGSREGKTKRVPSCDICRMRSGLHSGCLVAGRVLMTCDASRAHRGQVRQAGPVARRAVPGVHRARPRVHVQL